MSSEWSVVYIRPLSHPVCVRGGGREGGCRVCACVCVCVCVCVRGGGGWGMCVCVCGGGGGGEEGGSGWV